MSCYQEIRDELFVILKDVDEDGVVDKKKLACLLERSKPRGRFGLFDVLKAYSVLDARYFSESWTVVSLFFNALTETYSATDVDLWCMPLERDMPVAGQDIFLLEKTCASFLYGAFVEVMHNAVDDEPELCSFKQVLSSSLHWHQFLDPEILFRTLPGVAAIDPGFTSSSGWKHACECTLLSEESIFSRYTLLKILAIVERGSLDTDEIYKSPAMEVLLKEKPIHRMSAMYVINAILSSRLVEPGSIVEHWIFTYGDELRSHSTMIRDAIEHSLSMTGKHAWPLKVTPVPTSIACLCGLMSATDRMASKEILRQHAMSVSEFRTNLDFVDMVTNYFAPAAIKACSLPCKSAST